MMTSDFRPEIKTRKLCACALCNTTLIYGGMACEASLRVHTEADGVSVLCVRLMTPVL